MTVRSTKFLIVRYNHPARANVPRPWMVYRVTNGWIHSPESLGHATWREAFDLAFAAATYQKRIEQQ